ncbi:MAG TPA: glycine cleavage system aminomethyltransferase GcvT [Alphaproteobacteria bacterium]|nr:glycine cleavage system aminomethyltransferase GcvT [Alphaproteobacteria bacterium]
MIAPAKTPLYALHAEWGAKFVPFAGYALPIQYRAGILAEHRQCRDGAALFDVSHMGQVRIDGNGAAQALEALVPGDIQALKPGAMRYTMFTNEKGGVLDDLMVTDAGDYLFLVVNASQKSADMALLEAGLPRHRVTLLEDRALIALQGPAAAAVLARHAPGCESLSFMRSAEIAVAGVEARVSRSGYTGEDGFEISAASADVEALAQVLAAEPEVAPAGLGARDTLRLEAGLCLYGNDLTTGTTPVEAGLVWTISKRRRSEGGFPGDDAIRKQLAGGPVIRRVGIRPAGRAPARADTEVLDMKGNYIGEITSGSFGPTVGAPVAMGYVRAAFAEPGREIGLVIREVVHDGTVSALPFVPHGYHKSK